MSSNIDDHDIWIIGVSMTRFGRYPDKDAFLLGAEAALDALDDADLTIHDIDILAAGSVNQIRAYPAQRIQKHIGQTGIPAVNVINACATGATAVRTVHQAIKAGEASIGLAVGTEQMGKQGMLGAGRFGAGGERRFVPEGPQGAVMQTEGILGTGLMPGTFAQAGMRYAAQHDGVGPEQFIKIAVKNHENSVRNPLAQYQKAFTAEQIRDAEMIAYPNTTLMCCPTGDGASGAVLVSGERLRSLPVETQRRAVKISASVLTSDPWAPDGLVQPDINTLTRNAARQAYEVAGVGPADLDLVELHDCFATAELIHYDNLELCEPGGAGDFIDRGAPKRDGETPVNVSGGLLSKGHPLGATGVANIFEVSTHLRGEAGDRQVEGATVGLTHVIGLGSACSIHILEKGNL
ncbi:thiolase family protein [Ilumatobacter nonamiensis]|uniref:thiolase family protein n=1 Tax=Ilumatobacter nonamiensis TaxID=467093 RepID=UPI000348BB5B|nr:thiolase family protein [Ilumatobacter nonamiensis]